MTDEQSASSSEFEREPVPERALLGYKSFVGMYAGEHVAGTELMIGPLFIASGVSALGLLGGLLLGNLLAVLSWMLLTAPIATRARLTLYFQLEQICGRQLVTLYNLANGVMFCFLAGAMVTVSATALGPIFNLPMPSLTDKYPTSISWVVASLAVGSAIAIVAAFGYQSVAKFANIAAPWMVLVFLAFGIIALRRFVDATGAEIKSASDVWQLANHVIWKGGDPLPGQTKFTFWHVMFFAWFCNMAMHIGMSDLSVFRFARKSYYASASGAGMYVGHFMAWISASMLFAFQLHETHPDQYMIKLLRDHSAQYADMKLEQLQALPMSAELLRDAMKIEDQLVAEGTITVKEKRIKVPTPIPGDLAYGACGIAGLLCVIFAGWTTANPTIYRAGLAFQAIVPRASRFVVTLMTGLLAAVAGMFPGIAMKLLDFVAIYGMVLMPMGAVIFVDFWLLRKLGLQSNYAEFSRTRFNWAAGLTWLLTLGACVFLNKYVGVEIFFVSLPGWFVAAVLYVVLSKLYQKNISQGAVFKTA
jgi:purine-cytosine permease-like protein